MNKWEEKYQEEEGYQVTEPDLIKEERLKSKLFYKLFLIIIKYTPLLIIFGEILYSILAYFRLDCSIINYMTGFSLCNIVYLYVASYVFKFCSLYRVAITSTVLVNILAIYDTHIGIPLDNLLITRLYIVILLLGLIAYIKFHVKNTKKSTSKVRR